MSRHCVALAILALAGTALVLPEASARSFGVAGGARVGGFMAPYAARPNAPLGAYRVPGAYGAILQRPVAGPGSRALIHSGGLRPRPVAHSVAHGLGRNIAPDLHSRYVRRHHRGNVAGYVYPFTAEGYGEAPYYLGTPYDPSEAIPVYGPQIYSVPAEGDEAAPHRALVPRLTNMGGEGQDACRSERVTVPDSSGEGEREIAVVRC
jgi:hypothetical protein